MVGGVFFMLEGSGWRGVLCRIISSSLKAMKNLCAKCHRKIYVNDRDIHIILIIFEGEKFAPLRVGY